MSSLVGRQIGEYRILDPLGEGGMGLVYKAQHVTLGQVVAIKSLHTTLMNNQSARDRFVREAQALARLNHPNIIKLLNFINEPTGCYIVMEYADGEDLEHKLSRMGLIPAEQCLPWFMQACRGLFYAHKQGIIHRDIKPSNIIVHPSGSTKLLDFGTAKLIDAKRLTQHGMTLGTVIYMSKEQLLGKPLDARSDVYSLGVTLYECLTGQLPFYDEEERKLIKKIAKEDPVPPSQHYPAIPPPLEQAILKALSKEPKERWQTTAEFEMALAPLAGMHVHTTTMAPPAVVPVAPAQIPHRSALPEGPAAAGESSSLLLSPYFLIGIMLLILAVGGGIFSALVDGWAWTRILALTFTGVFLLTGVALIALASSASRDPSSPVGGASGNLAGGKCASCGRPMLPGMKACPFCVPRTSAAPPESVPRSPSSPRAATASAIPTQATATLTILDGNEKGQTFQITTSQGPFTMGRAPSCSVVLTDPGVSGSHARFAFDGPEFVVQDDGSRNGVFVNNQRIKRQPLKSGDLIILGSTRLQLKLK